jgi:hypothetical protein
MPLREMAPKLGCIDHAAERRRANHRAERLPMPIATGTKPAATPAAEPLDDPPGVCAGFHGLRVLPGVRNANSW